MPTARRFPPPWTLEEHAESFVVRDANDLLLMLEAANADLVTISLKRSTQNLQLSTTTPADYPISSP